MPIHPLSVKPYTISYKDFHSGELVKVTRRPPEKLHSILPSDIVKLTEDRNDEWKEGEKVEVKHISYRSPNVLQLVKNEGETTFVDYDRVDLYKKVNYEDGQEERVDAPEANKYLLWP